MESYAIVLVVTGILVCTTLVFLLIWCLSHAKVEQKRVEVDISFRLSYCVVGCDDNPKYTQFWPIVKRMWKEVCDVTAILIFVSNKNASEVFTDITNIIHFRPVPSMSTAFQSQCIRLLYPALIDTDDGVIISDMDLIPLSKEYYHNHGATKDEFVVYRDVLLNINQIAMCFNMASPQTWSQLFNISSVDDVRSRLKEWFKESGGDWFSDQKVLHSTVMNSDVNTRFLKDVETGFLRLDREDLQASVDLKYTDFHMPRLFENHKEIINHLISKCWKK